MLLDYDFNGSATFLNEVSDPEFKPLYGQKYGENRRIFAQDCRYYLEANGLISETSNESSLQSASGAALAHDGLVYVVLPPYSGASDVPVRSVHIRTRCVRLSVGRRALQNAERHGDVSCSAPIGTYGRLADRDYDGGSSVGRPWYQRRNLELEF